jgi:putative Mg2+ transporter-C (MgtC) family protein
MAIPSEWATTLHDIGRLVLAYLLALPVGWVREKEGHAVGIRTFPLTAMASCGYILLVSRPIPRRNRGSSRGWWPASDLSAAAPS